MIFVRPREQSLVLKVRSPLPGWCTRLFPRACTRILKRTKMRTSGIGRASLTGCWRGWGRWWGICDAESEGDLIEVMRIRGRGLRQTRCGGLWPVFLKVDPLTNQREAIEERAAGRFHGPTACSPYFIEDLLRSSVFSIILVAMKSKAFPRLSSRQRADKK